MVRGGGSQKRRSFRVVGVLVCFKVCVFVSGLVCYFGAQCFLVVFNQTGISLQIEY